MSLHNPAHWPEILFERCRERLAWLWRWEARLKGAACHPGVAFCGRPILSVARGSRMDFAEGVTLRSGLRSTPLGAPQPCVLRTLAAGAELIFERRVGLSAAIVCAARSIRLGEKTIVGAGAMILDNDFHRLDADGFWAADCAGTAKPIVIGRSVFIGARAIILKGVTLGDRAVIGAGAVVTRDVPAGAVAAGNPARVVPALAVTMQPARGCLSRSKVGWSRGELPQQASAVTRQWAPANQAGQPQKRVAIRLRTLLRLRQPRAYCMETAYSAINKSP